MKLRIGARGSHLARTQAGSVAARLEAAGHDTELVALSTAGDRSAAPTFAAIGPQGVFVREIERALDDGAIDVAVHSFKDLPTASPDALVVAAVPARMDPADALVLSDGAAAAGGGGLLPVRGGARIGTASVRRQAWIGHLRPDLRPESLRGNVLTRIRRLKEGRYDAIVLAMAGLERLRASPLADAPGLDLGGLTVVRLDPAVFVPAPAQGALALQCRRKDHGVREALAPLDDAVSRAAVDAERWLLARMEGGCELAFGAWCEPGGGADAAGAMVAMVEMGGEVWREAARGADPSALARALWRALSAFRGRG